MRTQLRAWALAVMLAATPAPVAAQTSLTTARELYASAAYEEALTTLDALSATTLTTAERTELARYRALCLFALGRTEMAEAAIDAMVASEPLRGLSQEDVPPRMRAAITAARQRLLPQVIQQIYAEAKAAFDRKDFEAASAGFQKTIAAIADPDLASSGEEPPLADLKTLAAGFHTLSLAAIPPPPPPPPPVVTPTGPDLTVYTTEDADVVPPQVISQDVPAYPGQLRAAQTGIIEVIIGSDGLVESALMRLPVDTTYDRRALAAAKTWRYRPAERHGVPVRFVRRIRVTLTPAN